MPIEPLSKETIEALRRNIHERHNNALAFGPRLETETFMRLLELLDRTELRAQHAEALLARVHQHLGGRDSHNTPDANAACVIDWIHDAKHPVEPLL